MSELYFEFEFDKSLQQTASAPKKKQKTGSFGGLGLEAGETWDEAEWDRRFDGKYDLTAIVLERSDPYRSSTMRAMMPPRELRPLELIQTVKNKLVD